MNYLQQLSLAQRIVFVFRTALIALAAGMAMCPNLWLQERFFPTAPLFDNFSLPQALHIILLIAACILLVVNILKQKRSLLIALLAVLCLLVLEDQNRLQPWVYMYFLILLPFALFKQKDETLLLNWSRILMIGIYAWSGIHKLNPLFINLGFRTVLMRFINDTQTINALLPLGYGIGLIEIVLATLLFFPRTRKAGVWLSLFSHVLILIYLSPFGISYNSVVYPWNIAMVTLTVFLFYGTTDKIKFSINNGFNLRLLPPLMLTWLMPVFNYWGAWDDYLSFSLYSYKTDSYYIAIADNAVPNIDPRLKNYFVKPSNIQNGQLIDIAAWSLKELNVPNYQARRIFNVVGRDFCNMGVDQNSFYFIEINRHHGKEESNMFGCADVQ